MKYTLLLPLFFLSLSMMKGQTTPFQCISKDAAIKLASKQERFVKERLELMDEVWARQQRERALQSSSGAPIVHEISVVFHVVTTSGPGISDVQIQSALDDLNASFRNTGYYDPSTGVDTEIQFCLAQRDPGRSTIHRY